MAINLVPVAAGGSAAPVLAPSPSRMDLASMLLAQGASTAPIQSNTEGIARLLQGLAGGFLKGQEERQRKGAQAELADALMRSENVKPWVDPDTMALDPATGKTIPGTGKIAPGTDMSQMQALAQMLQASDNPMSQEMGTNVAMADMQQRMDAANKMAMLKAMLPFEVDKAKQLAAAQPEKFGEPKEVAGPDGKPMLVTIGDRGTVKPVDGFGPKVTAPPGYRVAANGGFEAIPGGPADPAVIAESKRRESEATLPARLAVAAAGRNATNVNLPSQEKEYDKTVGKQFAETFGELQAGAREASSRNAQLDELDRLLSQAETGTLTPALTKVKALGKSLGMDLEALGITDDVGPLQAAQALSGQLALQLRNPEGGAGMPGAMSDKDREFLQAMVPGLGQTPEGRKMLIAAQKKVNQRSIQVAKLARDYANKNGRLDTGFYDELAAFSEQNQLFEGEAPPAVPTLPPMAGGPAGGPPRLGPSDKAAYDALPSGAQYIGPDGRVRAKP